MKSYEIAFSVIIWEDAWSGNVECYSDRLYFDDEESARKEIETLKEKYEKIYSLMLTTVETII